VLDASAAESALASALDSYTESDVKSVAQSLRRSDLKAKGKAILAARKAKHVS
jgi:hypothetical protein